MSDILTTELPTEQLEVKFNNELIEPAQEVSPSDSSMQPHVAWKCVKDKHYTLMTT